MRRIIRYSLLLAGGILLTAFVVWFAVASYLSALPVASSMQRGLALSLGQAIEGLAIRDPSFATLSDFKSRDIAYFALIDQLGVIRFHSNPDLIGESVGDSRYQQVFTSADLSAGRIRLKTGENIYESHLPLHLSGRTLALRLALHTWQPDEIVRRAKTGMVLLFGLVIAAWVLAIWSIHLLRRDLLRQEQMARREQLAQLGELGAVLAHEVRTPLSGIKGYAQLLQERSSDQKSTEFATIIVQEALRLEGLVNDLLTYARQDMSLIGATSVVDAVNGAWAMIEERANRQSVSLVTDGFLQCVVACPLDQLRQIFLNLFCNAMTVMPQGGSIRVSVNATGAVGYILVADSGPGFAEVALLRCFDPFYTTHASGSGLGLAVCRKIIEACGGTIMASNGDNGGARLVINLPVTDKGSR